MSERLNGTEFLQTLTTLGDGDEALHGMLFPRVYPPDALRHAEIMADNELRTMELYPEYKRFYDLAQGATLRGVRILRLRVVPRATQFGYDQASIDAMRRAEAEMATSGLEARWAYFDDCRDGLIEACGSESPLVTAYLEGARTGEPQKSLWSIRRRDRELGRLAVTPNYVGLMDYKGIQYLGHEPFGDPRTTEEIAAQPRDPKYPNELSPEVKAYERFWRDVFENAEPIT